MHASMQIQTAALAYSLNFLYTVLFIFTRSVWVTLASFTLVSVCNSHILTAGLSLSAGKCTILPTFVNWFPECNARYDTDKEDMELYETGWAPMNNSRKDVLTEQEKKSPWTYQGAWKLKGAPFWGMFASYWGGG